MSYFKLSNELIRDKNINSNEFRIYVYLMSLYNEEKGCSFPSLDTIAEGTNTSKATVNRAIKTLVKLGYMTIVKKRRVAGNFNTYKDFKHMVKVNTVKTTEEPKQQENKDNDKDDDNKPNGGGKQIDFDEVLEYSQEHQQKINLVLKQGIKLTSKQMFLLGDMDLEVLRKAIFKFKKKCGKYFSLLLNLYIDEAEQTNVYISRLIERYLKGSYIRMSKEERETQQALRELELYGVPCY